MSRLTMSRSMMSREAACSGSGEAVESGAFGKAPEIGCYIHIPFCVRKCRYCDFLSFSADRELRSRYVDSLCRELRGWDPEEEWDISTVFLGGGTPSLLEPEELTRILEALWSHHARRQGTEISMECNPGTLTEPLLRCCLENGVNRLSLGLQSADNRELQLLGRIHTWEEFLESYQMAREMRFANLNVDLMSALPGQTLRGWGRTLEAVTALEPEHISAYSLILEEGTPFYEVYREAAKRRARGESFCVQPMEDTERLPSEETEREMDALTVRFLAEKGYERYEISNYAKPGFACCHNIGYWRRKDYRGFGLGAASLVQNQRFRNTTEMEKYLAGDWLDGESVQSLSRTEQMEETLFLGLRMPEGVEKAAFRRQFGQELRDLYASVLDRYQKLGLLRETRERIFLTEEGLEVSNGILADFLLTS